jgi:molybdate transport system ATP-binding protein
MRLDIDIHHRLGDFALDAKLLVTESATGILGPSGSGKSTLLRCIAGLIKPDAGRIELEGEILFDAHRGIWIPPHRRRIGVVFQEPRLFPHWSVRQNLKAGRKPSRRKPPYTAKQVSALLRIEPLLDRTTPRLSGGEKQRVSLARTLLAYPRLLLMDEPLSGLDSQLKSRILPFLDEIHRELGIPTIMVSHDLSELLLLNDSLILMGAGAVKAHGRLSSVIQCDEMTDLIQDRDLNAIIGWQLHGRDANATAATEAGRVSIPPAHPRPNHGHTLSD